MTTDRILPETRWVAVVVIPFLVVAFVILYILPQETERLFAWKLQLSMSAMMLGAAYAGGIYFFTAVLLTKEWHKIKVGILPVTTFASLLGIATILHWDRFNILLILLAAILARHNFDWTNPSGWILVGGLATMLAGIIVLYITM